MKGDNRHSIERQMDLLREILLTADRLADKLLNLHDRLGDLTEMQAFLLDAFSQKLLEKAIHETIDEEIEMRKRRTYPKATLRRDRDGRVLNRRP